jgi:nucleoside-diphosphate-sugar epimerase
LDPPSDENILIRPAVEGTLAVMKAAHKHKVKRVVITSSCASIMIQKEENSKPVYTEQDWSDVTIAAPYEKSKTLAERAAWDFLKALPESERFELTIINPGLILGPSLIPGDFASA